MSKFFYLAKKIKKAKTQNCQSKKKFLKLNFQTFNIIVISLIIILIISYLIQINTLATKGYQIKELEKKITQLNQQKKSLELKVLEAQSIDGLQKKISQLNMVNVGQIEYLAPSALSVAVK